MNIKRFISIFLVFVLSLGMSSVAIAEGNSEIPEGYTPIYTAEDLNNIRNNLSGKYILMNDIDLSVYENWEPIGTQESPFTGELNGNGFVIEKMVVTSNSNYNVGLFGFTKKAVINNFALINSQITLSSSDKTELNAGLIIGRMGERTQLKSCTASGNMAINGFENICIGGLVGYSGNATVGKCSNYAEINVVANSTTKKVYVGGLIGYKSGIYKQVYECANFGNICLCEQNDTYLGWCCAGGICGLIYAHIYDSYNRGNVTTEIKSADYIYIGGVSGLSTVTVCCYNSGEVNIPEDFSGFAGALTGNAEPSQWGTPGSADFSRMERSYYSNDNINAGYRDEKTYEEYDGEFQYYGFYNVKRLTDEEMLVPESFIDFDFETVWTMEENGYPVLQNQPMINVKEEISLEVGETFDVDLTDCEWSIEDETIAAINENGKIIGLSAGETILTVEIEYGYSYEYTVTVSEPEPPVDEPTEPNPPVEEPDEPNEECYFVKILTYLWSSFKWAIFSIFDTIADLFN